MQKYLVQKYKFYNLKSILISLKLDWGYTDFLFGKLQIN